MPNFISEDQIEQATLRKLQQEHGFQLLNCHTANAEDLNDRSHRTDKRDVILRDRLLTRLISGKLSVEDLNIHFPPSMTTEAPYE